MFKQLFLSILCCLALLPYANCSETDSVTADSVTYDWLIEQIEKNTEGHSTDHLPHWRRLFNTTKVQGFLECSCGLSTKYFLDNAEQVISIEYVMPGYGDMWFQHYFKIFQDQPNWTPMLYNEDFRSNSFNNACAYQCALHKDYALIDATYLRELFQHYKSVIKNAQSNGYSIDAAFVDSTLYVRGDLVKVLLAHKIPIVAAHDTLYSMDCVDTSGSELHMGNDLYGWSKITTPPDYVRVDIPFGAGTTFWISSRLPEVIRSMQDYRDNILQLKSLGLSVTFDDLTEFADEIL